MRGFSVLFLLLFVQGALASQFCTEIFLKKSDYLLPVKESERSGMSLEQRGSDVIDAISRWADSLKGHLKVGDFGLQVTPMSYRSSAFIIAGANKIMSIGLGSEGRPHDAIKVVVGHEFGHLIFFENLVFDFRGKKWTLTEAFLEADLARQRLEHNPEYRKLISEIKELSELLSLARKTGKGQLASDLAEALARRQQKAMEIDHSHAFGNYMNDVLMVYNELFADTFAVLMTGKNPKAITEALDFEHDHHMSFLRQQLLNRANNDGPNVPRPREFAVTGFKNWKHEIGDNYTLLDPARGVLWELYMKNITPENIPVFFKTFLDATGRHVEHRLQTSTEINLRVSAGEADPVELNQSFLKFFAAAAKRNGLPISK